MYRPIFIFSLILSAGILFGQAQESKTITVSTSYNNLLSNKEQTGMLDKIVTEAFSRIGLNVEILYSETAGSLSEVNNGLVDVEINRIEGIENSYPNLIRVDEPNMIMEFVAFSRTDFEIDGWDSIRNLYIGIVKGWKIYETSTSGFPHVSYVPTETELFRMLNLNRLDIALYSKLSGYSHILEKGYTGMKALQPPLAEKPMYMYLHESRADLAAPLATALREMKKDGTYEKLVTETLKQIYE